EGAVITVPSWVVSFCTITSPPPATVAVLKTVPIPATASTLTVTVTGGYASPFDPRTSLRVQVKVASTHVQPVPLIAVAVRWAGRVSPTLTTPVVGPLPTFWTRRL